MIVYYEYISAGLVIPLYGAGTHSARHRCRPPVECTTCPCATALAGCEKVPEPRGFLPAVGVATAPKTRIKETAVPDPANLCIPARSGQTPGSACPLRGDVSERVHSHYNHTLADLAWQGRAVSIQVRAGRGSAARMSAAHGGFSWSVCPRLRRHGHDGSCCFMRSSASIMSTYRAAYSPC
jgi:hypothetical protein